MKSQRAFDSEKATMHDFINECRENYVKDEISLNNQKNFQERLTDMAVRQIDKAISTCHE